MRSPKYRPLRVILCAIPVFAMLVSLSPTGVAKAQAAGLRDPTADRIQRDINFLASDKLEGRLTGTPGNDSAAAYLARRAASLGLRALEVDTARAACRATPVAESCRTFLQHFTARSAAMAYRGYPDGVPAQNVVSMLRGRDPALRSEYVVVGAHFDHLGRSAASALDPEAKDAIRHGADDNASGTAAVMEMARLFAANPPKRSLIFVNFTGEELGLLGSLWFVEHAPVALESIRAMVNFDMVGRLRNDKLIVSGITTATELAAILDSANVLPRLTVSTVGTGVGPSDHSSFYAKGIPVLHFFTDSHEDYHRATDLADKINSVGEARVVALAERMVRAIADWPTRLTVVRGAAPVAPRQQ